MLSFFATMDIVYWNTYERRWTFRHNITKPFFSSDLHLCWLYSFNRSLLWKCGLCGGNWVCSNSGRLVDLMDWEEAMFVFWCRKG